MLPIIVIVLALCALLIWALRPPRASAVKSVKPLPRDFIWGVSGSAFQSEGGALDSNWHRLNAAKPTQDRYALSIDFLHRYGEDIGLAQDLGVNTFRLGVEWARVEPQKGQIDVAALAYYDDVFRKLKQAGITPLVTLNHFSYPGWVDDRGGWLNPQTVSDFLDFTRLIVERYRDDVRIWITFNEAVIFIVGTCGINKLGWKGIRRMRANVIAAHRQAYDVIHAIDSRAQVTSNIVWMGDHLGATLARWIADWFFFARVEDKCDLVSFDYYSSDVLKTLRAGKPWKWPTEPAGLYRALKWLGRRYAGKPLLIAETGMATQDGQMREDGLTREDVLRDTVYWTQRARDEGVDVIGYMVWSLTDNYEWGQYSPRFGLYTVNVKTDPALLRIATPAVAQYRQAIRDGGMPADYQPVLGR